jgi:radical SAM protein with 4Fe4S-binding SPASM domain
MRYILKLMKENPRYYLDKIKYYPRGVVWELTLRCNMNCAHCGSEAGAARGNELNHEEALDLCRQLGEMGCERLTLLGGEPFLREDWDDLALSLYNYGIKVNVITNGYLMDQALIERIKKAKLTNVAISLDGGRAETHEKIRRKPGAFQRVLNGLSLLRQNDISPAMVTAITKDNLDELDLIRQIGIERKVDIWQLQVAVPRGNLCENRDFVIEPEDLPRVEQFVLQARKDPRMRIDIADNVGYFSQNEEALRDSVKGPRRLPFWTGCFAGIQVLGIEANGDIKGCLSLPTLPEFIEGNVRKESLADIWNKPGNFSYNRNFHTGLLEGDCADCEYNYVCRGGCKSSAYCFSGSAFNNPMCLYRLDKKRKGKLPDSIR